MFLEVQQSSQEAHLPSSMNEKFGSVGKIERLFLRASLFLFLLVLFFPSGISPGSVNPQGPRSTEFIALVVISITEIVT